MKPTPVIDVFHEELKAVLLAVKSQKGLAEKLSRETRAIIAETRSRRPPLHFTCIYRAAQYLEADGAEMKVRNARLLIKAARRLGVLDNKAA